MKVLISLSAIAAIYLGSGNNVVDAINLKVVEKVYNTMVLEDGPTNGEMQDDEKDTLIQVLCPGNIQTSFS
jgi:hypothetical protein